MKPILIILSLFSFYLNAQTAIETNLIKKERLNVSRLIDVSNLNTYYYLNFNEFTKKTTEQTYRYTNLQLGNITNVNTFNPLKINLFYHDFNSIVILDNRLAEIFKIDFNQKTPYRNPSHISAGYDNTFWMFNDNTQQLELYDYKTNTVRAATTPINSNVLDLVSDYNYAWLLTEDSIFKFNYVGSLVFKIKNDGFTNLAQTNENIILQRENSLYYLKRDDSRFTKIALPELLIKQFLVTNETLYIYNNETLYQFQLKTE